MFIEYMKNLGFEYWLLNGLLNLGAILFLTVVVGHLFSRKKDKVFCSLIFIFLFGFLPSVRYFASTEIDKAQYDEINTLKGNTKDKQVLNLISESISDGKITNAEYKTITKVSSKIENNVILDKIKGEK